MRRFRTRLAPLAAMGLAIAACDKTYTIEMRPNGPAYERTFSGARSPALEAYYGPADDGEGTPDYSARFVGATPSELGGLGSLEHFASPLGGATVYTERFGGNDSISRDLLGLSAEMELLAADLEAWVAAEVPRGAERDALQRFVREDLVPDFFELLTRQTALELAQPRDELVYARWLQYLLERGYMTLDRGPAILARALESSGSAWYALIALVDHKLKQSPYEVTLPEVWQSADRGEASLLAALPRAPSFAAWARSRGLELVEGESAAALGDDTDGLLDAFTNDVYPLARRASRDFQLFGSGAPYVHLRIHLDDEPLANNGEWKAEERRVEWTGRVGTYGAQAFATWAEPDRELQTKHLGNVVMVGSDLGEHALYYSTLDSAEQQAWTSFVETLEPGEGLVERIRAFRLPSERESEKPERSEELTSDLVKALEAGKSAKPTPDEAP